MANISKLPRSAQPARLGSAAGLDIPNLVRKGRPRKQPYERLEQEAFFYWLSWLKYAPIAPLKVGQLSFAIPNGAFLAGNAVRRAIQANALKRQGLRQGVPDAFVAIPVAPFAGLFIEFKRIGANKPGPEQLEWHERLRQQGYAVYVCYGAAQAQDIVRQYLGIENER